MATQNPFPARDSAQEILDASDVQSNRLKASAWDAYYQSQNEESFRLAMDSLPLPRETKAALWDAKFGKPAPKSQVAKAVDTALEVANPMNVVHAVNQTVLPEQVGRYFGYERSGPINTLNALLGTSGGHLVAAGEAAARGDVGDTASHAMSAVPIVGQISEQAALEAERGEYGQAAGRIVGTGASIVGPSLLARARVPVPPVARNPNVLEAAAVNYGQRRGIPLDAATTTGHRGVANVQKRVSESMGGASVARDFKAEQAQALTREGNILAGRSNAARTGQPGRPYDAVSSGEAVQGRLESRINAQARVADSAYDELRALEAQQAQQIQQTGGHQAPPGAARPFTNVPLAVDVRAAKTELRPLYESLLRERDLGVPMQGGKGRTFVALDGLMNGPDMAPISVVDAALGDLKAMSRTDDLPALRTPGQATAAQAVKALEAEVMAAAQRGGPDVVNALQRGRQATIGKYQTAAVRDTLSGEPAAVFRQLTQGGDTGLKRLQALAQQAPREVRKVARAYLENMMDLATREGGFAHGDRLWADWQKLGPETKAILFPDRVLRQDLDNFFMLAKKAGENVNPSGTGGVVTAVNMWSAIPANVLARMLYSRRGVQALTQGFTARAPRRASAFASRAVPSGNLMEVAREFAEEGAGAVAEDQEPAAPTRAFPIGERRGQP